MDKKEIVKYNKKQLLNSKKYEYKKDVVNALLDDDKDYTIEEVDKIINKFLKEAK